jgi:hypothetical protein
MSCEYLTLEDLCLNKYTYSYVSNSGDTEPVYRTDKDTGQTTLISFGNNLDTVMPCDPDSEEDIITAWNCYQIWKDAGNIPSVGNISDLKNQKKTEILSAYNEILAKNYTAMVDSVPVEVDLSLESNLDFVSSVSNVKVEEPIKQEVVFTGIVTVDYAAGPEYNYTPGGLVPTSIQTITVPEIIKLPATVTCVGGCDDGLTINGVRVSSFAQTPPPFVINERTFEAGTYNDGGPWVCRVTFYFQTQATGLNNFVPGTEQTTARPTNTNLTKNNLTNNQWNDILTNYSAYSNKLEATKNQLLQQVESSVSSDELNNIVLNDTAIEQTNPVIDSSTDINPGYGIQALDGSSRYFRYAVVHDDDCCYFGPLQPDGMYIVAFYECNPPTGLVIYATNNYADTLGQTVSVNYGYSANPTWKSLATNAGCCNADGSKVYVELIDEIPSGVSYCS